jgi:hypothetical protein
MNFSPSTLQLLDSLEALSGNRLTRRNDLGLLIEVAAERRHEHMLEQLSFHAKFISKTHGIMSRIGKDTDGYDKLLREFQAGLEKARGLLQGLLAETAPDIQHHYASTYLTMTAEGLQNFLALLHDLSWYKNWINDQGRPRR